MPICKLRVRFIKQKKEIQELLAELETKISYIELLELTIQNHVLQKHKQKT